MTDRQPVKIKKRPRPGRSLTNANRNAILSLLLAVATIALYSPVIGYPFLVFDDHDYVTANFHIHRGLAWSTIKWAFKSTAAANWHPFTWLSHALDYQLFAMNAAGHHLDSVLLHAINAVLLFLLLWWVTKRTRPSLLVAALFALHPINVESVAWIAERKNVLSTLFFLLAIAAYVRYAHKPDWRRYLLVAALFAAGLMAKPMVITLPFVLLLLDYWPLGRIAGSPASVAAAPQSPLSRLLLEKIPLLLLSAASAWITLKAQRSGMAVRSLHQYPLPLRIENAIVAYGLYLWKTFWPAHLSLYPHSAIAIPAWQWILSALILISVTALVLAFRRKGYLPVGWFWFLGTLVPVIGLVQVGEASMADRYAYIPLVGIFLMISFGLADLAEAKAQAKAEVQAKAQAKAEVQAKAQAKDVGIARQPIPALALCALAALSFLTHRQIAYWDSDYDLWAHTLAIAENPVAHDAMGSALLDPDLAITPNNRDDLDTEQKRMDEARRHFERAIEMRRQLATQNPAAYLPDMANTLNNLGNLDRLQGKTDDARKHYEEALKIHLQLSQQNQEPFPPDLAQTLNNLGSLEKDTMQIDAADRHFKAALKIYREMAQQDPDDYLPKVAEILNNLGFVARSEAISEARLEAKLEARPEANSEANSEARSEAKSERKSEGRSETESEKHLAQSRAYYEEALTIRRQLAQQDPDTYRPYLATTLNDLGILDAQQNRPGDARRHYDEALQSYRQLADQNPAAYLPYVAATLNNLALLDETQNRLAEARAHYQEDLTLFKKLFDADPEKYARDVARVEANLQALEKQATSR